MILAAAAVVAMAIAPVVLAYLQLGYNADVRASAEYNEPAANAQRVLGRSVHEAAVGARGHAWRDRERAVDVVRAALEPRLETLEASQVTEGTAYRIEYNRTAAAEWAAAECPSGPARAFGPCEADRGVVVQERAGETAILAVALDVRVVTERGYREVTVVVRTVGEG